MVLPRGLKTLVNDTAPGKFVPGKWACYQTHKGAKMRGITRLLNERLFSSGTFPTAATANTEFRGTAWKGRDGGRKRGVAVDKQVSKLAGATIKKRIEGASFKLSRMSFIALEKAGLEPVGGQRVVLDADRRIGTAVDILCYSPLSNRLVVVELKSGFSGNRALAAVDDKGKKQKLASPCSTSDDCLLNQHFAQLTVTRHLLAGETELRKKLKKLGVQQEIDAVLLYVCDRDSSLYKLDDWWQRRGKRLVDVISQ
jgi:hypothetical protein